MGRYDNKDDDDCGKKPLGGTFLTPEESLLWRKVYSKDKDIKKVIKEFKKQMNYSKGKQIMLTEDEDNVEHGHTWGDKGDRLF